MEIHWNNPIEKRYQHQLNEQMIMAYQLATLLASVLFPAFSLMDWLTQRGHFQELTFIRYVSTFLFICLHLGARKKVYILTPFVSSVLLLFLCGMSIILMCLQLDGYESRYYAGVNLVILGGVLLFPWGARKTALATGMIVGTYALSVAAHADFQIKRPELFINNVGFLLGTAVIGVCSAYFFDRLRRQSFLRLMQMEAAKEEIRQHDQMKTQFWANVSHELRTPLALIIGPLKQLLSEPVDEPISVSSSVSREGDHRKVFELMERNAQLLLKHINDLLDVAKIEAKRMEIHYQRFDLASLARLLGANFESQAMEKRISFHLDAPACLMVEADPEQMEKIILNLLANAFKFTPVEGRITFSLEMMAEEIYLRVADSGPGIPLHLRERIFERFYQVEESLRRQFGGTGLGLAIVKEFVDLHQGRIRVDESEERGALFEVMIPARAPSNFTVTTPVGKDSTETPIGNFSEKRDGSTETEGEKETRPQSPLVILVEDHPEMRNFIKRTLTKKFQVKSALNGHEGLDLIRQNPPDLILTDVMMPDMSGIDLMIAVRSHPEWNDIPLVFLTAKADDDLRLKVMKEGAQDYLLKPFSAEELLARISNLITLKRSKEILSKEVVEHQGQLENMILSVKAALEARDEFISIASHELKTPLTAMKLQNDLSKRKLLKRAQESSVDLKVVFNLLERNETQLARLIRLVEEMFDMSLINRKRFQMHFQAVELKSLIKGVIRRLEAHLKAAGVKVDFQEEGGPLHGEWDGPRLEQALINLLMNVCKYAAHAPVIVKVVQIREEEAEKVFIHVQDFGPGIAPDNQERIFERFERGTTPSGIGGLGLGLYITREIVQSHGGKISVKSDVGQGCLFLIELPLRSSFTPQAESVAREQLPVLQ